VKRKERKDVTFEKDTSTVMCLFEGIWGIIIGNISGANQPLYANYGNFNPSHTMLIQRGAQKRWEE
jgi:hypothetical protein